MKTERLFQMALLISLAVHGVLFIQNYGFFRLFSDKDEQAQTQIELQYLQPPEKIITPERLELKRQEPLLKIPENLSVNKVDLPPLPEKEKLFKAIKAPALIEESFTKPSFIKPDVISVKTKITLSSSEDLEKDKSPSYVAHSQIVREKIKRALYQNYNRMEEGQVYVSFILDNKGNLKNMHLNQEKSSSSGYLREIAINSIKDASPFPPFPQDLKYEQLSFNVIISFEIE